MISEYSILPPHWSQHRDAFGNVYYFNEVTQEESNVHPYEKFLEASKSITRKVSRPNSRNEPPAEFFRNNISHPERSQSPVKMNPKVPEFDHVNSETRPSSSTELLQLEYQPGSPSSYNIMSPNPFEATGEADQRKGTGSSRGQRGPRYDYHCQWSERDLFGKVTLYGLTIRFLDNGDTLLKFDGIDGEWTYTSLKGPYGCLEMYDLYIGAKVTVFGRHLTISSANAAACEWINEQAKKLRKQQEVFRKKIESVGAVPCIKKKGVETITNITRNAKTIGQTNLRQLMKENARLGEQMANLGLSHQI